MRRYQALGTIKKRMREIGAPTNWLERHMAALDAARNKKSETPEPVALTKKGKRRKQRQRMRVTNLTPASRDRYPNE